MNNLIDIFDKNFPKYDIGLKILFVVEHSMLREMLNIPQGIDLPLSFPDFRQTEVDVLVFAEPDIYHVEFQSWNDAKMPYRMFDYLNSIMKWHVEVNGVRVNQIRQQVLYVGTQPIAMRNSITQEGFSLSYALEDIRNFEMRWRKKLAASPKPLDWILALICSSTEVAAESWLGLAEQICRYNRQGGPQAKLPLAAVLLVAASLRKVDYEIQQKLVDMFRMKLEAGSLLREVYDQGVEHTEKSVFLRLIEPALTMREITLTPDQKAALVQQPQERLQELVEAFIGQWSTEEILAEFFDDNAPQLR